MAYSEISDMLLGDIPATDNPALEKYVKDAADEIDSKIGRRYQTPIQVSDSQENRSTRLLLHRINNWLASGRYLLAVAASSSQQQPNAYALGLVKEATLALDAIVNGDITLPGASFISTDDVGKTGPQIHNTDTESNVEAFYEWTQQDPILYAVNTTRIFPAGSPRSPYTW